MDIVYLGHSSFKIKGKGVTVVTDPYLGKSEADIVTVSHDHFDHNKTELVSSRFVVNGPGEYEIGGVSIVGVGSFHDDKKGIERGKNTIYVIEMDGMRVCHLGDLGHKLEEGQLEEVGNVDIVMVPVGGVFTIDAKTAVEVVKQLEASIVIPMHYDLPELTGAEVFLKEMGLPAGRQGAEGPVAKLMTMTRDKLPSEMQVVWLKS